MKMKWDAMLTFPNIGPISFIFFKFWGKWPNNRLVPPPLKLVPPLGNPESVTSPHFFRVSGSATDLCCVRDTEPFAIYCENKW